MVARLADDPKFGRRHRKLGKGVDQVGGALVAAQRPEQEQDEGLGGDAELCAGSGRGDLIRVDALVAAVRDNMDA